MSTIAFFSKRYSIVDNMPKDVYWVMYILLIIGYHFKSSQGQTCYPKLIEGAASNPSIDGSIRLECDVTLCRSGYAIEWRKVMLNANGGRGEWLTLYRYIDEDDQGALERNDDHDIKGRTRYFNVAENHVLIVDNVTIYDNGTWNCDAVYSGSPEAGDEVNIIIPVQPKKSDLVISTTDSNIVDGKPYEFHCTVNKVNPEPIVTWSVDGENVGNGEKNNEIKDGYWSITNIVILTFTAAEKVEVKCAVGDEMNVWEFQTMNVDVKAKAHVDDPTAAVNVKSLFNNSYSLNCSSSGYFPTIQWTLEDTGISEIDTRYAINTMQTETSAVSSLTSKPIEDPVTCDTVRTYQGNYKCIVTLKDPYGDSTDTSPDMKVIIEYPPIADGVSTIKVGKDMQNVVVTCNICASEPVQSDNWVFPDPKNVEDLKNGSILITTISVESLGNYTRTLSNGLGTSRCIVTLIHDVDLDVDILSAGAIAGIVVAVLIVIITPIFIFLFIAYKKKKKQANEEVVANAESGNSGGPGGNATNGVTTATTPPVYAEVDKNKKSNPTNTAVPVYSEVIKDKKKNQNTKEPVGAVYSQITKPGRPLPNLNSKSGSTNTGPVYSEVSKPKQGRLTPIENHSHSGGGGEYEAVGGIPLPPIKNTRHFDNTGQHNAHGGLHYADVDFLRQGTGTKQSHGTKNPSYEPTEYAQIDHRKSAGIVV